MMIQAVEQRCELLSHLSEVDKPTVVRINLARAHQFNLVAVAVQPATLVASRHVGKSVRGLKSKLAGEADAVAVRTRPDVGPSRS